MKKPIAIILTTFIRDELLYQTISSILDNWNDNYVLLVLDQGKMTESKLKTLQSLVLPLQIEDFDHKEIGRDGSVNTPLKRAYNAKFEYWQLPWDVGLSYSRNFGVERAKQLNIPYCLITADSIKFTQPYNFQPIIEFLEVDEKRGTVGFNLKGRICWECDIDLIKGKYFLLDVPKRPVHIYQNINFQQVDLHRNFFLAKTKCLLDNKWSNELKLSEHEDFFWRLKQTDWEVFYTDYIEAEYVNSKPTDYNVMRRRMGSEFRAILKKKYGISGWVNYTKALQKCFNEFRKKEKNNG